MITESSPADSVVTVSEWASMRPRSDDHGKLLMFNFIAIPEQIASMRPRSDDHGKTFR